ncbi:MAG: hypothetical protein Q9226_004563 [Calogaya cf. arnoldii]
MKSEYAFALPWLAMVYPLATSAQRDRGSGGRVRPNRQDDPVVESPPVADDPSTSIVISPQATASVIVPQTNTGSTNQGSTNQGSTNQVSTGGGSSGECGGAVAGNMNVRISGDPVSYRFEPPVPGNPSTGTIGDCDVWSFPPGWNDRVHIGGGPGAPDGGTLFEYNVAAGAGFNAMDVSYVEGFSVPMMCTDNTNDFMSGCWIDLFSVGTCPTGGSAGGVCRNPQGPGGDRDSAVNWCEACSPPDPFFAPCAAAAYTFPTDDAAVDGGAGLDITCVVGASSEEGTGREGDTAKSGHPQAGRCEVCPGSTTTKRSLEDVMFGRGVQPPSARSPSMLPRAHKRFTVDILGNRPHRHGLAHGSKVR